MSCTVQSLTIKDFKSIAEVTLSLGKVNVFIGENGAGKSNLLEALGVLSAAVNGKVNPVTMKEHGVRISSTAHFPIALKTRKINRFEIHVTLGHGVQYAVALSPNVDEAKKDSSLVYQYESVMSNGATHVFRDGQKQFIADVVIEQLASENGILPLARALRVFDDASSKNMNSLAEFSIFEPSTAVLRKKTEDYSEKTPLGLYGGGLHSELSSFLQNPDMEKTLSRVFRKLFPWIHKVGSTIDSKRNEDIAYFEDERMENRGTRSLRAYNVNEGALYALFLLVLILHPGTPPFFAVDNMDSALNPRLADALLAEAIKLIKMQPGKQMMLTTHNPSMLNALDLFDDDVRLFVVERSDADGSTRVRRVNPAEHMTRETYVELTNGAPLSNLWVSGALGGLPSVFPRG